MGLAVESLTTFFTAPEAPPLQVECAVQAGPVWLHLILVRRQPACVSTFHGLVPSGFGTDWL